ncbi:MAG TPA: chlorite dismutase family protein [Longimicrobiales bacterium]
MPETTERTLNHFAVVQFTKPFWALPRDEKARVHAAWLDGLRGAARKVDIYQVFPTEHAADVMVWSALEADDPAAGFEFFDAFARATNPVRQYLKLSNTLWGYTRPSQYSKAQRSPQEMDPFDAQRKRYLTIYPFVKTVDWYLLSRDVRQGMMNEHIRVGKQYPEILQLLLYSFGVQDQEFVVVYEMDDLRQFSDLVADLRAVEGRKYTERDTPLHTALWRPPEETLALFR